jgi:chlorite dismutase
MPCHSYLFFDIDPELSPSLLAKGKKAFIACVKRTKNVRVEAYATLAFKSGTRFMLHVHGETPEVIQLLARDLLHTSLGSHLHITYTLFGMTRPSPYHPKGAPKASVAETPHRYLVVYPFTKTIEWHLMPYEERRIIMKAHVDVGRRYSRTISQLLLYSYGVDDHEFIVSYQMDSLEEFQSLVMDMRATESRRHTKSDTPIFMGIHMPLTQALNML